ncbi:MAG: peptidylprolyl isomerase [Bacteroidales bacterium]|nr:peptidylprolyl isomerase [Bacteroidales bacterium]
MKYLTILFAFTMLIGFTSCNKEDDLPLEEQKALDIQKIETYLADNNLEAHQTASGLFYTITDEGTGAYPNIGSNVTVQYTGKLLDGTAFDNGTATFPLTNVIAGWQEGIPLFKIKGRGKLYIPSYLGYGATGTSSIPGNSVLIFDIYLISFN